MKQLLWYGALILSWSLFFSGMPKERRLKIMSFNVRNGIGMDNVRNFDRTASVIRKESPDIVALQELDSFANRSNKVYVLGELARRTGYEAVYAPAIPHDGGKYGVGLLSKEKPLTSWMVPLPGTEERRMLQVVEFERFVVFNVHLSLTEADRVASAELINAELLKLTKPVFLAGDFNDTPDSKTIQTLVNDKWKLMSERDFTFPANKPNTCIDYIFASQAYKVRRAQVIKARVASDHRPVVVEVRRR